MRNRFLRSALLLPFLFFFITGITSAQSEAGKVIGVAADETGTPIVFVTVSLVDAEGVIRGSSITNEEGIFSIKPVPPGVYSLRVSYLGNSTVIENVKVNPNKTVDMNTITINTGIHQD